MKKSTIITLLALLLVFFIGVGLWSARQASRVEAPPKGSLTLRIPDTKFMGLLPLYVAEEMGFFRKEGLVIQWADVKDPGQAANLFFSGQSDFLMTTFAGALPAESRQPGTLRLVCAVAEVGDRPGSFLLVPPNSPVQNVGDLRGKTIGTYSGASQKAYALLVLEKLGMKEPQDFRLVQVPSSAQVTSLFGRAFDALFTVEPYGSVALQQGARALDKGLRPKLLGDPFWLGSGVFTRKFLASNPDAFTRLTAALSAASRYIVENEKDARVILAHRTSIEPEVAAKCALYHWEVTPTAKQLTEIQAQFDLLESSKLIEKAPRASELFSHP
jgi:NitT/TauT family transport system substrate-binding protein